MQSSKCTLVYHIEALQKCLNQMFCLVYKSIFISEQLGTGCFCSQTITLLNKCWLPWLHLKVS